MGLSQALSAALAGINITQQSIGVISGNVANSNTPGYVDESLNQNSTAVVGQAGSSVAAEGINRNLNQLLQSQIWTETSGNSYATTASTLYTQLQNIYGTPGSSSSFDSTFSSFTTAVQTLASNPSSYSDQTAAVSAAQSVASQLNSMTTSIQQMRTQAESGIATDVQTANGLLSQIAYINNQLSSGGTDSAAAQLEDQRGQDITQLSQLMNVNVVQNSNNQVSVFTSNGQQLVGGAQASQLSFNDSGTLTANAQWSANPSLDGVGTITMTSPGGATTDLIATGAIQSGEIGAYLQMRDSVLPQAQTQLDEFANQMAQALSNQTVNGTAVTSGSQSGYSVDTSAMLPGNTLSVSYTDSGNVTHTLNIVSLGASGSIAQNTSPSATTQTIGVNFSGGMASVVSQLNAALGSNLQFSNPSGSVLQVVNANGNTVNSASATTTLTSLQSGSSQLPLFTDGSSPITGAIDSSGSQTTGLAGRITVNAAVVASPSSLVNYSSSTASGDPTRPDFLVNELTTASLSFSPTTGVGSQSQPYNGTLTNYLSQVISQQSQAANAATNLQQGQATVLSALQQRLNDESGVNIDTELSNLIELQNTYAASARVMSTVQAMMSALMQVGA